MMKMGDEEEGGGRGMTNACNVMGGGGEGGREFHNQKSKTRVVMTLQLSLEHDPKTHRPAPNSYFCASGGVESLLLVNSMMQQLLVALGQYDCTP